MLRFLADHNFSEIIIAQVLAALPNLDLIRARDIGMARTPDSDILEWAANSGRIVLTHDIKTMVPYAWARVAAGLPMPGVLAVMLVTPYHIASDDIVQSALYGRESEWANQVRYSPLP